jgi:regulator of sigma E protease
MLLIKIVLGLMGLGIVVFVHELGHFLAARLVGIDVEAFSIGWGNPLLKKKIGSVEYRLGMFPLGGYCKMKGENDFKENWERNREGMPLAKGGFFAASPQSRILVAFAGPFFNLVFAVLILSAIWGAGFEFETLGNRVVLVSEINPGQSSPADEAGLLSGDRIIEINGKKIAYFHELRETIAVNPEKTLPLIVDRDGELLRLEVRPDLDKSSGAGIIGVYPWTDPVIAKVRTESPAALAGLADGDRLSGANGKVVRNSMDFSQILKDRPASLSLEYERNGVSAITELSLPYPENGGADPGFSWAAVQYRTPRLSFPKAVAKGAAESWKTLIISLRGLRLLFRGIDLTQAVSGPVRITYMMGDVAAQGFGQGLGTGLRSMADFLALISIALCVMNLLPLPILDGGMILLYLVELVRRKPANPRAVSVFQTLGAVIIFGIMIFAVFGDILYFVRR